MGESEYTVDTLGTCLRIKTVDNLLHDTVNTADSRDYPYLVTDTDLTVGAHIAVKGEFRLGCRDLGGSVTVDFYVGIIELTGKIGLNIVMVKVGALFHVMKHMTDGETVLDDILALSDILQGNFMPCRNIR